MPLTHIVRGPFAYAASLDRDDALLRAIGYHGNAAFRDGEPQLQQAITSGDWEVSPMDGTLESTEAIMSDQVERTDVLVATALAVSRAGTALRGMGYERLAERLAEIEDEIDELELPA